VLEPLGELSRTDTSILRVKHLSVPIGDDHAFAVGVNLYQPCFPSIELLLQRRKITAGSRWPPHDDSRLSTSGPELHWRSVRRRDYNVWQHLPDFVSGWHNGMIA
jgi:hypothetical protein